MKYGQNRSEVRFANQQRFAALSRWLKGNSSQGNGKFPRQIIFVLLAILFSFLLTAGFVYECKNSNHVYLSYIFKDPETHNYRFYTDNLSDDYPFGKINLFDAVVGGSDEPQTVTFSVPRNSVGKLRFDPSINKEISQPIYLYRIVISDLLTRKVILPEDIVKDFHGFHGLQLSLENDAVKITFSGVGQYAEALQGLHGEKTFRAKGVVIVIFLFCFFAVLIYFSPGFFYYLWRKKRENSFTQREKLAGTVAAVFLFPLLINICMQIIQSGSILSAFSWIQNHLSVFWESYLFLALIYSIVLCLSNILISTLLTGLSGGLFAIINYYKLIFRGTPVFPWDFSLASEVASILGGLNLQLTRVIVKSIFFLVVIIIISAVIPCVRLNLRGKWRYIAVHAGTAAVLIVFLYGYVGHVFLGPQVKLDEWNQTGYYEDNGLIPAFMKNMKLLSVKKVSGYSKETMEALTQEILQRQEEKAAGSSQTMVKKPNIIMVMNESFWDITQLPGITFEEEEFPTINWLRENAVSGYALTSIFGGGTSSTEFEAVTGFTKQFLPPESTPYQQIVLHPFFSLASYLKNEGYETLAMHPYRAENWNRNVAYPNMGFESFLSYEDFTYQDTMRGFISDMSVTQQIISEYEKHKQNSDKPWMNLTVTVQNHPNYSSDRWSENELVNFSAPKFSDDVLDGFKDLATGLHESDLALGELINYFKTQDDPTIIVFFGDHESPAGNSSESMYTQSGYFTEDSSLVEKEYKMHQVPVVMWSNYMDVKKDLGIIGAYEISATMLQIYGLSEPPIFSFLNDLREVSPGYSLKVVLNPDGTYSDTLTAEQQNWYYQYQLLQYDYIYGHQYAAELWE